MGKGFSISSIKPEWPRWKKEVFDVILNIMPMLSIRQMNGVIKKFEHLKNDEFIGEVCRHLGVNVKVEGIEDLPAEGPVTIVANHPGGADILATITAIGRRRKDFSILANELICIDPVKEIVIPVATMSSKKVDFSEIDQAYKDGRAVVFFAAGKNSRYNEEGQLRDRKWRSTFLHYSRKYNTPVVVLHIGGANTSLFYKVSRFRERHASLKNIPLENMFQLRELRKAKGDVTLTFSKPVSLDELHITDDSRESEFREAANKLHTFVYEMDQKNRELSKEKTRERSIESA